MQQLTKGMLLHGSTYRIEQVLGQGSFGITYLATHTALDKKVAIKEFFMKELNGRSEDGSITGMSDGSLSMDYARKFQKEALNLARLEHPNIVRVTDSFEDNGTFYYVMDYIEGKNLNDYVKTHRVSHQEAVSIICDVAEALLYMHEEKHMLHLDLKPGNIMRRNSDGHIFLIDFGLSKHYSKDGQPETSTTIGLGTAGYAPIEQANQAKNGEFRPTIDVYALGATLYKLLTRETPPAASELVSDDKLLEKNLKKHKVSTNLTKVVVKAMLPNVRMRIQTIKDFMESLATSSSSNSAEMSPASADNENTHVYVAEPDDEGTVVHSPKVSHANCSTEPGKGKVPKKGDIMFFQLSQKITKCIFYIVLVASFVDFFREMTSAEMAINFFSRLPVIRNNSLGTLLIPVMISSWATSVIIGACNIFLLYKLYEGIKVITNKLNKWLALCIGIEVLYILTGFLDENAIGVEGVLILLPLLIFGFVVWIVTGIKMVRIKTQAFNIAIVGFGFIVNPLLTIACISYLGISDGSEGLAGNLIANFLSYVVVPCLIPLTICIANEDRCILWIHRNE